MDRLDRKVRKEKKASKEYREQGGVRAIPVEMAETAEMGRRA